GRNATQPFWLDFLQSFSTGWQLYPLPSANSPPSATVVSLTQTGYPSAQHFLLDGFANAWYITEPLVNQGSLRLSAGGTWQASFLLFFKPQSYFNLAAVTSVATGLAFVSVLAWVERATIANLYEGARRRWHPNE
ncbi:MAG: hypothetical protein JRN67_11300, partial [Nitrososphaerota archaeon]|nr:hypothetical protein [Nitrososphaerota archaeon]